MGWIDSELALTALAAMLSPTTLMFSVLVLVLGDRPRRTGLWFYLGALGATLAVGVVAAFVIGNVAASSTPNSPKTWVAIVDVVFAAVIVVVVVVGARRPATGESATNPRDGRADQQARVGADHRDHRRGRRGR